MNRAYRSDSVSYSRPRSLPMLSLPPFGTATTTNGGSFRIGSLEIVRLSSAFDTCPISPGPS